MTCSGRRSGYSTLLNESGVNFEDLLVMWLGNDVDRSARRKMGADIQTPLV